MRMRWLSWLWLALGLALLGWLMKDMELLQTAEALGRIGWRVLLLLPLAFLWMVPNTIAWKCSFKAPGAGVPFSRLLTARIAGESINDILPSSNLGGEPVKALLLSPAVTLAEALSSVTVAKTTQTLSLVIFILGGLVLAAPGVSLPPEVVLTAAGVVAGLGGGAVVLALGSSSGLLGRWTRWGLRLFPNAEWLKSSTVHILEMDASLSAFYKNEKGRFAASTLWHLLGLVAGSIELYVIARFLGFSLNLREALIMEVVATLAAVGGFFIPGSIGAFEYGHHVGASMLGLPPGSGVILSLVRRFRELFWLLAGLALLYMSYPAVWKGRALDGGNAA